MADSHAKMTQATPREIIVSILAGLFAPLLAIFLIVQLVLGIQDNHKPDATDEAAQQATVDRIKPFATLVALDANAPKVEKSGQEVYDAVCASCHAAGALGAPKFDNKGDWAARIGKGYDTLVKHAIEGFNQMPARGGDGDLSDVEVARAVAYMANSAGASFRAPEPSAAVAAAGTAGGGAKGNPAKGKAVYEAHCAACHAAGVAGAPKFGDKAAWEKRISQGYAILLEHATKGIGAMPAKGGADISDAELADAVAYLYDSNGGKL